MTLRPAAGGLLLLALALAGCGGEKAAFEEAMAAFDAGRMQDAAERLSRFLDRYPAGSLAPEALYQRGTISLLYLEDLPGAAADLREVARDFPKSARAFDARLAIAGLYETRLADGARAREEYSRLLADFPGHARAGEVRYRLGDLAYRELAFDEARGWFGQLAQGEGSAEEEALAERASFRIAQSYDAERRGEEGVAAWSRTIARFPKSDRIFEARLGLAGALEQSGKGEEALDLLVSLREGAADPAALDLRIAKLRERLARRGR